MNTKHQQYQYQESILSTDNLPQKIVNKAFIAEYLLKSNESW